MALNYGGRRDPIHVLQQIAQHVQKDATEIDDIANALFAQQL